MTPEKTPDLTIDAGDIDSRGISHLTALVHALIEGATLAQASGGENSILTLTVPEGATADEITHLKRQITLALISEPWSIDSWDGHPDANGRDSGAQNGEAPTPLDYFGSPASPSPVSLAEAPSLADVESPISPQAPVESEPYFAPASQ